MNTKKIISKSIALTLAVHLLVPTPLFAQAAQPQAPTQKTVRPYLIVDGFQLPDNEVLHMPVYRTHLLKAFEEQPQVQLVDYNQVVQWKAKYAPNQEAEEKSYFVEARDALAKGKKFYQQLEYDKALEELSIAKKEFIINLSHLRSNRDLLDAHLYLGMTYIALASGSKNEKQSKLAENEFEKVVMLDPQRELSLRNYSPDVIQIFDKVKKRLTSNNRITVTFDANVPQAKVYLNGKLLGPTPIKTRLIPGDYYFLAERKGMKSWSQLVKLRSPVEHITANLKATQENADWNGLFQIQEGAQQQTADMEEIVGMSRALGGEIIFLANLEQLDNQTRLLGQLYDIRTKEYSQVAISDVGKTPEDHTRPNRDFEPAAFDLAVALSSMIRPDGYLINSGQSLMGVDPSRVAPQQAPTVEEHAAPDSKLYEHWWFWAGIVAVGVGGYFAVDHFIGGSTSDIVINNRGNF